MKTVFNRDQVAHIWANGVQSNGRTSNNSFFFYDGKLYSYGQHFTVAERLMRANGQPLFLVTDASYSATTHRHIASARNAIRGITGATTIHVPEIATAPIDTAENAITQAGENYLAAAGRNRESLTRRSLINDADTWSNAARVIAAFVTQAADSDRATIARAQRIIVTVAAMPDGYQERAVYLGKAKAKMAAAEYVERAKASQARGGSDARGHYLALADAAMLYRRAAEVLGAVGEKGPRVPAQLKKAIEQALPAYRAWHIAESLEKARCLISYWKRGDSANVARIDGFFSTAKEHGWAGNATSEYFYRLALKGFGAKRYHAACVNVRQLRDNVNDLPNTYAARRPVNHAALLRTVNKYLQQSDAYPRLHRQILDIIASLEAMQPEIDAILADAEKHAAESLQAWRNFETNRLDSETTRLRVRNETVFTSRGAEVSAAAARRAWQIVQMARGGDAATVSKRFNGHCIGPFRFDSVSNAGDMKIGCHTLIYSELAHAAEQLGFN